MRAPGGTRALQKGDGTTVQRTASVRDKLSQNPTSVQTETGVAVSAKRNGGDVDSWSLDQLASAGLRLKACTLTRLLD